jgi:hypothetical protein
MTIESIKPLGEVERIIEYLDGSKEIVTFKNTILKNGRNTLARCLAHDFGAEYLFYVNAIIWGNNGTTGGAPKLVATERTGLFGPQVYSRPVISTVDNTQVIFTSVIPFNPDGLASPTVLNEMALVLANGDLYSMVTFPDLTKTSSMQITWSWRLMFV